VHWLSVALLHCWLLLLKALLLAVHWLKAVQLKAVQSTVDVESWRLPWTERSFFSSFSLSPLFTLIFDAFHPSLPLSLSFLFTRFFTPLVFLFSLFSLFLRPSPFLISFHPSLPYLTFASSPSFASPSPSLPSMAEVVQFRMESMIPALHDLEERKIFNKVFYSLSFMRFLQL
jgi:hypothetical protein